MRPVLAVGPLFLMVACSGGAAPPEQMLADQCQLLTDAFNAGIAKHRAGTLSTAQSSVLISLEPIASLYCNPDAPPTDVRTALQNVHDAVGQLSLIGGK